jgi:alkylated DNA repair protein alkB family protein 1
MLDKSELDAFVDVSSDNGDGAFSQLPPIEYRSAALVSDHSRRVERFVFDKHPGLMLLRNAFSPEQQLALAQLCLVDWPDNGANKTNLTRDYGHVPHLFEHANGLVTTESGEKATEPRVVRLDSSSNNNNARQPPSTAALLEKRRWTTLGYQYDWTARVYDEREFVAVPPLLFALTRELASLARADDAPRYVCEAVIVNYYHRDSNLCGHLDDAERFYDAPIVSLSLGLQCIFLLGGETRATPPTPLLLRSGDCILMGGQTRRCYHGVPRIFADSCPLSNFDGEQLRRVASLLKSWSSNNNNDNNNNNNNNDNNDVDKHDIEVTRHVLAYLQQNRVNINARQANPLDSPLLKTPPND